MMKNTRSITVNKVQIIDINHFLKHGLIERGKVTYGQISWLDYNNVQFIAELTEETKELRLMYQDYSKDKRIEMDYTIEITSILSNLGKGEIWYFVCPEKGCLARILYKCNGSLYFKSRTAYSRRIYYPIQLSGKYEYHQLRYISIDEEINRLKKINTRKTYRGNETKINQRIKKLEIRREHHDNSRFNYLPRECKLNSV